MKKNNVKSVITILLFTFLLISLSTTKVKADTIVDLENGYTEKGDRVTILDEKGMMYFAKQVNEGNTYAGKYVSLAKDVDLKDYEWIPIGKGSRSGAHAEFCGTFDGYNHTIKNLNVYGDTAEYCYGLFGVINGAKIVNVIIESGKIESADGVDTTTGAIVACMLNEKSTVENCKVGKNVTVEGGTTAAIVGRCYAQENYVYNCESNATVTGLKKTGGIVGITNNSAILYGNKNTGKITGGNDGTAGILGYGNKNTFVAKCENTGSVTAEKNCGGIVGYATGANGYVVSCINKGAVTTTSGSLGGIVGIVPGTWSIQKCINEGVVTGGTAGTSSAGGIAGSLSGGSIIECENKADVTGCDFAGGVVGETQSKSLVKDNKGGNGTVKGKTCEGRIIGNVRSSSTDILSGNSIYLYINDGNGDSYTDLPTVGGIAANTGNSLLTVEEGTLRGIPQVLAQARILFEKGTKWDSVQYVKDWDGDQNVEGKSYKAQGTDKQTVISKEWSLERKYDAETTWITEPTTTQNGQRKYLLNGVEKIETINKVPVIWGAESNKDESLSVGVTFKATNDSSVKEFIVDKIRPVPVDEIRLESTTNNIGLVIEYTDKDLTTQAKYYKRINYNTNGGSKVENEIYYFDSPEDVEKDLDITPTKEGYVFVGWYLDKELTKKVDSVTAANDVDLYAKWVKEGEIADNENGEDNKENTENENNYSGSENENTKKENKGIKGNTKTSDKIVTYVVLLVIATFVLSRAKKIYKNKSKH